MHETLGTRSSGSSNPGKVRIPASRPRQAYEPATPPRPADTGRPSPTAAAVTAPTAAPPTPSPSPARSRQSRPRPGTHRSRRPGRRRRRGPGRLQPKRRPACTVRPLIPAADARDLLAPGRHSSTPQGRRALPAAAPWPAKRSTLARVKQVDELPDSPLFELQGSGAGRERGGLCAIKVSAATRSRL
jgi:hypothetical protein